MPENFLVFKAKHLSKINAQRRALSQPKSTAPPALTRGEALYIPAGQMDGKPATCYHCPLYNYGQSCQLIGPHIPIHKFTYPPEPTADAKPIEYWPCCGMFLPGEPNYGEPKFLEHVSSPANLGLCWINAPEIGMEYGGACCGGALPGADDCDHYISEGDDKRKEPMAFCRVLQQQVENGAVCAAWRDDDAIPFHQALTLIKELEEHSGEE